MRPKSNEGQKQQHSWAQTQFSHKEEGDEGSEENDSSGYVWIHCDKDMVGKKITRIKNHLLNLE
jgi:hypothetical protein